ncbi:hypothetical protein P255_00522 [Acinetobacter brisouii CIP 110357]|uniref:Uncharacterized protein n=1 Tax=Acinetobacter brisouii CIP 110357 TaxID=1341683 RepID=V2UUU1_9GAMM|nr:hypothetical protein [Acinetobacter brisouii]ENV46383.1 hypothetical protein F954_02362 [Acinetobacter brisouii ANC 4119]ESK52371.1 hypothetical protein P255_00522 [Acinetobacter brisouii CIP 110357]
MPKLNDVQNTALEIIDFIYFFDFVSLSTITARKVDIYERLNDLVESLIVNKNLKGQEAETYKHYLLCGVEILATYNAVQELNYTDPNLTERQKQEVNKQVNHHRLNLVWNALLEEMRESKVSEKSFAKDVVMLTIKSGIGRASHSVSFRLVAQMLAFEQGGNISCHVYRRLIKLKILNSSKETLQDHYDEIDNKHIFLRALLFVEFEMLRKRLFCEYGDQPLIMEVAPNDILESIRSRREAYYQKYQSLLNTSNNFIRINNNVDVMDSEQVQRYIKSISKNLCHNRIFSEFKGTWISLFGTWHLICEKGFELDNPIYAAMKNDDSCSARAEETMRNQYGFVISARSLKDCYNRVKNLYFFIRDCVNDIVEEPKHGFIAPDLATHFYYHPNMSKNLLEVLEEIKG